MTPLVDTVGPAAPFLIDNVNTDMIAPMYRRRRPGSCVLSVKREELAGRCSPVGAMTRTIAKFRISC